MPGKLVKHVHFSESPSSAPSPTFSSSTLPSTPGPITPPLGFESPYHYTPLPRDENAVPNPIIAVAKKLLIEYDLSQPPSTAIILLHNIPHKVWEQPATQPFSSSIEMICPRLPWKLTVNSRAHPFVTIGDVLEGLYRLLRTNVTPAEFPSYHLLKLNTKSRLPTSTDASKSQTQLSKMLR
ncbi:hypothetical protein CPB84DRAFT_1844172 [Gymnopilus junonius]|uniref:DUF6699 domain-containing protein n=1 Tax=Gymnopilus junonius TaxID=109634 RepID=A0A9P5NVY8_GYMJU|nr:hypothetical protein CPB84DRAFT_1844172 [Gymnopilus junonius]